MRGQSSKDGYTEFTAAEQSSLLGVLDRLMKAVEGRQALQVHQLLGVLGDLLGAHCPSLARRELDRLCLGVEEMLRRHRERGQCPTPEQILELRHRIVRKAGRA